MRCPHDSAALSVVPSSKGLACPTCFGRWLVFRDVEAVARAHNISSALLYEDLNVEVQETSLKCPRDCGLLKAGSITGIEVDWCQGCKGIWFDNGELKNLLALQGGRVDTNTISAAVSSLDLLSLLIFPWK